MNLEFPVAADWPYFFYLLAAPMALGYWLHKKRAERHGAHGGVASTSIGGDDR